MEFNSIFFLNFVLSLLIFYIPGQIFNYLFFPKLAKKIHISVGIGLALWALQSYCLNYLGFRWLSWFYVGVNLFLFLKLFKKIGFSIKGFRLDKLLFFIVIFGTLFQMMVIFPSGFKNAKGIWFYHINAFDGIYYLSLDNNLVKSFPPSEPGFAGEPVIHFNYFANLVIADMNRMFKLPLILLQFQALPLIFSIVFGLLAYDLGLIFSGKKYVGRLFSSNNKDDFFLS